MRKLSVLLLGPQLTAVSGVSTHLNQLFGSNISATIELRHFQLGSEGSNESAWGAVLRLLTSPVALFVQLIVHRPDIVHINTSLNPKAFWRDIIYMFTARALWRKVVYQVHGGELPEEFCRGNRVFSAFLRWVLSLPQVVVLLAQVEFQAYRRFAPAVHLVVVPNAIETERLTAVIRSPPTVGALQLMFLGRLVDSKGVFQLLEAMNILRNRGIPARLLIVGIGPAEARIRAFVASHDLGDCVTLRQPAFGDDKDRLWQQTDVFPFPTYHPEGLPYALLESMAAGAVPVICAVGAIPDVMQNEVHGLFVPPRDPEAIADAVARLNADRKELARMSAAGRQRILENYTVSRLASAFTSLYQSL